LIRIEALVAKYPPGQTHTYMDGWGHVERERLLEKADADYVALLTT
jgi:hypothetical protein